MTPSAPSTRLHPAVCPDIECLAKPLAPCTLCPDGTLGVVKIDGTTYTLAYVTERRGGGLDILGYELGKADGTTYAIPYDLQTCECLDFLTRDRPGGCKHTQTLADLRQQGLIA